MVWYKKKPSLLKKEREELKKEYPTLSLNKRPPDYDLSPKIKLIKESVVIEGPLPIIYRNERLATYNIRIHMPDNYPKDRPILYCNDKPLYSYNPRSERHINDDYSACLCVNSDYKKYLGTQYSITKYITKLAIPFFKNQYYFDAHGQWPTGSRAHGKLGIVEFIEEHTGIKGEHFATKILLILSQKENFATFQLCPCGSNKTAKNCHGPQLQKLRQIVTPEDAKKDLLNFHG